MNTDVRMLAKAFHGSSTQEGTVHDLHDKLAAMLDALGESGRELNEAVAFVLMNWKAEHVISEFKF